MSGRLRILQLEFPFKRSKNVSVTVIFFILSRVESFFCLEAMMNKKSIVEDHKVIASNVTLTDLTDSIKTILKKKTKQRDDFDQSYYTVYRCFLHLGKLESGLSCMKL